MTGFRYKDFERNLLVGEGNFSFANALVKLFEGNGFCLHATSYDTEDVVLKKYSDAADILEEVRDSLSLFACDVTRIHPSQTL